MSLVLDALAKGLFGAIVNAFNAWRRDRALQRLGYTEAQRDGLQSAAEVLAAALAARDRSRADADERERLRERARGG